MKLRALSLSILLISGCQIISNSESDPRDRATAGSANVVSPNAILPGITHLYFEDWAGPRLPVWVYVPDSVDPSTAPIMFMMHGAKRGAARYLSEWDQVADRQGFIVVAPEFSRADFPGSAGYNLGNRETRDGETEIDEPYWSFSAIGLIFDFVVADLKSTQTSYTLYGHSAGSQFVHRFLYFKPDARIRRVLAANAGWYTFPDFDVAYPAGLGGLGLNENDLRKYLETDMVILLGDQDSDPNHSSLKRDDGVGEQGAHRFARGQNFYASGKAEAERLGVEFGWHLRVVEGVAHSNGGIAAASGDLVD